MTRPRAAEAGNAAAAPLLARLLDPAETTLFDGAMGTMLYARGVYINQSYDALNLRAPELVGAVHHAYAQAGAQVLETNSFGANRLKLAAHGRQDEVRAINLRAAALARSTRTVSALVSSPDASSFSPSRRSLSSPFSASASASTTSPAPK